MARVGQKKAGILWALIVVAIGLWVALRIAGGGVFIGDMKALLPQSARNPAVEGATRITQERLERRLVLLVGGNVSLEEAASLAVEARQRLIASQLLLAGSTPNGTDTDKIGQLYFKHRFGLLPSDVQQKLQHDDFAAVEDRTLRDYFSPFSSSSSELMTGDPLLFLPGFLRERIGEAAGGNSRMIAGESVVEQDGQAFAIVQLKLTESPFSIPYQQAVMPVIRQLRAQFAARGLEVHLAGVLPHAAAGTDNAQSEVSTIGSVSLIAVTLLLLLVFRSARPLVFSLISIGVGTLVGLAACMAIFGHVHLFTMVFAVSLVGTAEDFTFHYFSTRFGPDNPWRPAEAMHHVLPSLTWGLLTTLVGFLGMIASGVPGLIQIAVFSIAGLTAAFLTTIWWYPAFSKAGPRYPVGLLSRTADWWLGCWGHRLVLRWGVVALAALMIVAVAGAFSLHPNDDIRQFQALNRSVAAEEQIVTELAGARFAGQYLLVQGSSTQQILEREEAAAAALAPLVGASKLGGFVALSRFAPSEALQRENILALKRAVRDGIVVRVADRVGLPATVAGEYASALDVARPLDFEQWFSQPAAAPYRDLWLGRLTNGGAPVQGSAILLREVKDIAALRALKLPPGVMFLDPVQDTSAMFTHYRLRAMWLIIGSYLIVALLLCRKYGLQGGLLVMAVPVVSSLVCLGVFGFAGTGFSLFHTMALLLVLGMGVDFGIFFRESQDADRVTLIAIFMSTITALLSFGLLGFSQTAAISAFGQTVALGIVAAFFIAPLARLSVAHAADASGE